MRGQELSRSVEPLRGKLRFWGWWFARVIGLLMMVGLVSAHAQRFEAEEGDTFGGVYADSKSLGYSGWGYVTSFTQPGDAVEIKVQVPVAGFYTLWIGYAAKDPKYNRVLLNGLMEGERIFPATKGFERMPFGRIMLRAGTNTVRISADWGWIDIDYVELQPARPVIPFRLAKEPVSPGASTECRGLYQTLTDHFERNIFAGQQDEQGQRFDQITNTTGGKLPSIMGLDLLRYSGAYHQPDGQIERAKNWVLQNHGIVTISWHWLSPFGATGEVWKSFSTNNTTFDGNRIADETSPEYRALIRDLDQIAEPLKILRDAHVPVLWRPLHEAEGKWFWWGASGPECARKIYRLMFERFTKIHGLNNLIWVWTTTDNPDALKWYPGDDCVDILGTDIYSPAGAAGTFLPIFDNLRQMYGGRKMIALTETDSLPDPDKLETEGANWLWFLIWDDYISRLDTNPPESISRVYSHRRVVDLARFCRCGNEALAVAGEPKGLFGSLQMNFAHAGEGYEAGWRVAMLAVNWDKLELQPGTIDANYVRELLAKKQYLRHLGYKLQLDPGLQYPPDWVSKLPCGQYRNQFGDLFNSNCPGENLPNVVFNARVRAAIEDYFGALFSQLGTDWDYVRLGGGKFGELNYPQPQYKGHDNCYWAFDGLAQGKQSGLPKGVSPCPVPGWRPGSPSPGHQAARNFIEWYLNCLKNYEDWQIATVRKCYHGDLCLLYGGWGLRPGWLERAVEGDLKGSTPCERNGEIQQGFDWSRMIGGIRDPRAIVYCTWMDGTINNRDICDDLSRDPARWSPVHWQWHLAQSNSLRLRTWGENTGRNSQEAMRITFERIKRFDLMGVMWAFDPELFVDPDVKKYATFKDFCRFIRENEASRGASGTSF